jgi:hypothetical protein
MLSAYQVGLKSPDGQVFVHKCVSRLPEHAAMGARRNIYDRHKVKAEVVQVKILGTPSEIFPNDYKP